MTNEKQANINKANKSTIKYDKSRLMRTDPHNMLPRAIHKAGG